MIEVKHLVKSYGSITPLKDFNCVINDGDIISVIGSSGCGKSTFIRCLNLLEKPDSGEILFDGRNILKGEIKPVDVRKYVGMVFQSYNLYPHLTVLENIMVPQVDILKRSKQEAYDKAIENLKMVDLVNEKYKYPNQLSGGQMQRVAIARTLAMDNKVLLLDEPTSALDPIMVREVQYVIRKLAKAGKTMVIVTHKMRFAREISNRVFYLDEGLLYEEGAPEKIFVKPDKEKTYNFINCVNEKSLIIVKKDFEFISCISEIDRFAERNNLHEIERHRLEGIFEELVALTIIPKQEPDDVTSVKLSYSEMTQKVNINIRCSCRAEDIISSDDDVGPSMLKLYCESIDYNVTVGYEHNISIVMRAPKIPKLAL